MRTRRIVLCAVCCVALLVAIGAEAAAAASGSPRALLAVSDPARTTVRGDGSSLALVGDHALVARHSGPTALRVLRVALAGEPAITRLMDVRVPLDADVRSDMSASPETAGLIVDDGEDTRLLGGPPLGPLAELARYPNDGSVFVPVVVQAAGARLFATEVGGEAGAFQTVLREPGAAPRALDHLAGFIAIIAGDLVAYTDAPVQPSRPARKVVVADWRTGARQTVFDLPRAAFGFGVAPDGRVVVGEEGGGILELRRDGSRRRVASFGEYPAYAGDRIVFIRDSGDIDNPLQQLVVAEPDGRLRDAGVPTKEIVEYEADERRILWTANGCVLVADLTAPATRAPGAGPCRRSELHIVRPSRKPLVHADRRIPVDVRCVAAAPPGCLGNLTLATERYPAGGAARRLRFRIPAGKTLRLRPRLTRPAYAAWRATSRRLPFARGVRVRATATDPAGRRSSATASLFFRIAGAG